jgi:hypothetical protein
MPQDQSGKNFLKLFAKDYLETSTFSLEAPSRIGYELMIGFIFSPYMSPFFTLDSPPPQLG